LNASYVLIDVVFIFLVLVIVIAVRVAKGRKVAAMSPEERANYQREQQAQLRGQEARQDGLQEQLRDQQARQREQQAQLQYGPINPQVICPHCQTRGTVRTIPIKKKTGISGGKATAAFLTGGVSLLATGLSRKEAFTQAHCGNCNSVWSY
jgi:hypothetical protein